MFLEVKYNQRYDQNTEKLFFQKTVFHFQFQQKMQKSTLFEKTVFQFFHHISGHI